jgi:hypothetical protein
METHSVFSAVRTECIYLLFKNYSFCQLASCTTHLAPAPHTHTHTHTVRFATANSGLFISQRCCCPTGDLPPRHSIGSRTRGGASCSNPQHGRLPTNQSVGTVCRLIDCVAVSALATERCMENVEGKPEAYNLTSASPVRLYLGRSSEQFKCTQFIS